MSSFRAGGFVGRQRELRELFGLLERAMAGAGSVVVISGEGGIGKTRLCEEFAVLARDHGAAVAWAACWESAGVAPFWPWRQLLDQMGVKLPLTLPAADGPDLARAELFASVVATVRSVAQSRPWLLVLDDAQWADPATLQLLTHAAPSLRSVAALLVVTVREAQTAPQLLATTLRRHARTVELAGLGVAELADLVETLTESRIKPDMSESLHRITRGNPLFAAELARRLYEHGQLAEVAVLDDLPVPPTVRAVLDERLAELSDRCRELLAIAALLGGGFPLDVLTAVAGSHPRELLELIEEAVRSRVLVDADGGRYAFSHPLLRSVVADDIGVARRVALHLRIAQSLEARAMRGRDADLAALSFHYLSAAPGGTAGKAVHFAQLAAQAAMAALGYEAAAQLYDRALTASLLGPAEGDSIALLLGAGEARAACGDMAAARRSFLAAADRARRTGSPTHLAAAALGLAGSGFEVPLFDAEQIALLEEALVSVGDDQPALRSRVSARLSVALSLSRQEERRAALSGGAVRLAQRSGDPAALAQAFAARCDAQAGPAHVAGRAVDAAEIVRLGTALGDRGTELLGRRLRLLAALELGDMTAVDAEIHAFEQVANAFHQPRYQWYVKLWHAMRAATRGDMAAERSLAREAERLGRAAGSVNCDILALAHRWFWWLETGETDTALRHVERLAPPGTYAEMGPQMVPLLVGRPLLAGRHDEARAVLDVAAEDLRAAPPDAEWLTMLAQVGDLCFRLGGHDLVPWLYDTLAPFADLWSVDGIGAYAHGPVHRQLGLLAVLLDRPGDAVAHFDAALAGNRRAGAQLLAARTLLDRGTALHEPGTLRTAQDLYRHLGVERRVEEISGLLAAGPAPAGSAQPDVNELRRNGDVWAITFAGRRCTVRDSKGVRDLARLLAQPTREIAALDLAAPDGAGLPPGSGLGPVLDIKARAAYKARLVELEAELDDADATGDSGRSSRAQTERDALISQLSGAYGLAGRPRRSGEPAERARTAVTARVRDAIRRITGRHPELGRHLSRSVRTGTFCCYDPDPPVTWQP